MSAVATTNPGITTDRFRQAMLAGDPDTAAEQFAPDGVVRSPISAHAKFHGRTAIRDLFKIVLSEIDDVHFDREISDGNERGICGSWRVHGVPAEETLWLRFDTHALITEMTVFVRPLPALTAMAAALAPRLAARRSRQRGLLIAAVVRPLAALSRTADRPGARLAGVARH